jgi:hypothetical protein
MMWLPYENFYIDTNLKPDAAEAALAQEVAPDADFSFKTIFSDRSGEYFLGTVASGSLKIRRQIYYRNSFLPRITGTIEPDMNGSRVHIKMKLHIMILVFVCAWTIVIGLGGIAFILKPSDDGLGANDLVPLGMVLFVYLLSMGGFKFESIKAKKKLAEIFQGSIEEA